LDSEYTLAVEVIALIASVKSNALLEVAGTSDLSLLSEGADTLHIEH